jgi:sulfide:quinone oxidoreductase
LPLFSGGRLVVNVVEQPIKCPVAPLEFLFLADQYFRERGMRDRVELVFATPMDGAFTKPIASKALGYLLEEKAIEVETEFACAEVDRARKVLRSYDDREVPYDLLVTVPTHSGAEFVERSGIGDELAFVPTDRHTLAARELANVFVLGDATDVPASKAGSVAHFEAELLADNLLRVAAGQAPEPTFDGHSNCFIETGAGRAMFIDFNYDVEPLPGHYPTALGPLTLLEESRANHLGKLAFRWLYWHALLPGRPLPVSPRMSMTGKHVPSAPTT